jgi:type I restriction enzyme S subunit
MIKRNSWQTKKLGEICQISTGSSNANEAVPDGEYAFFDRSKTIKKSKRFLFDCEALIIPGEGAEFFPRYYSGKFDLHQRAYAIFGFDSKAYIKFIEYYLIFDHKYFERVAVGATAKSLRRRHFEDLLIPFPPLPEQQRLVKILDQVFAAIEKAKENAERNIANTRYLLESYLQNIFAKPTKEWQKKKLGDVCSDVGYGTSAKSQKIGKIPVLRMGNIQNGEIDWSNLVYANNEQEVKKYFLKKNDILFNRTNSAELVGKTAIYRGERSAIFAGYLIRVNYKPNMVDPNFLNIWLNRKSVREYGFSVMISSVNQANISGSKLKEYPIVLPPIQEQHRIVAQLDILSTQAKKLEAIYQKKLADLEELKKSLLQKVFNGEV